MAIVLPSMRTMMTRMARVTQSMAVRIAEIMPRKDCCSAFSLIVSVWTSRSSNILSIRFEISADRDGSVILVTIQPTWSFGFITGDSFRYFQLK
jgi:hypothetical protein